MKIYTTKELAQRNGKVRSDIWIAYKGYIYDVTTSPLFKGGKHYSLETGIDLTDEMPNAPHLEDVLGKFVKVGRLQKENDIYVNEETYTSQVLQIEDVTRTIRKITISRPEAFIYLSGQYMSIVLSTIEKRHYTLYSTSLAEELTFLVKYREKGKGTKLMFHELQEGETLTLEKAKGTFVLPTQISTDIVFIVSDVGISNAHAMILDLLQNKRTYHKVTLLYQANYQHDIFDYNVYQELSKTFFQFLFVPILVRENRESIRTYLDNMNLNNSQLYISGWLEFVENTKEICKHQISSNMIYTEVYI